MSRTPLRAVRVDPELWEKARAVAEANDSNLSAVIRDALRAYIKEDGSIEQDDHVGWYEFLKPVAATTHIGYVHEGGSVYLPEGPDVVTEQDFHLAAATNYFWRLVRA